MTPNDIQVSRSKVSVEGQAFSLYVGEGGISVLQTAIFSFVIMYLCLFVILKSLLLKVIHLFNICVVLSSYVKMVKLKWEIVT